MFGLFVEKHAEIVAKDHLVSVLYIHELDDVNAVEMEEYRIENGVHVFRYFVQAPKKSVAAPFLRLYSFLKFQRQGFNRICKTLGKPNINHVHILTRNGILPFYWKMRYGIPYVITEHWSRYLDYNPTFRGFIRKWTTKIIVKNANALSTVSDLLMKGMNKHGLHNKKQIIIPNIVDTKKFHIGTQSAKKKIQIIHISCFEDQSKNISGMLRSIKEVSKIRNDFEFTLIGIGPDFESLRSYADALEIPKSLIRFKGLVAHHEIATFIQQSDFMVLFSNYETFGIVAAENLACGKPIVLPNTGALPEIIPDKYAYFVEPGDEKGLKEGILTMMNTYQNYAPQELHNYVKNNFSEEKVKISFEKLYELPNTF